MRLYDDIVITGNRAIARSYAKVNLTLDVLGKRDDGYHDVKMIMQTLSLFDLVIVDRTEEGISVTSNLKYLPSNDKNVAYKAVQLFFEETGLSGGAKVLLHKNIPVAAGLAGGSGNAGAVLCALDRLYNTGLSDKELCCMGAKLGADVPFCILGGTQLAKGIGTDLSELPPLPKMTFLLVKPPVGISTAEIYEAIDTATDIKMSDEKAMIKAIKEKDISAICKNLSNMMEKVTAEKNPSVLSIKEKLMECGAKGAVMSGSGPTVFGIFDSYKLAKQTADEFLKEYDEVFVTSSYN